jgi:hypothetical protein
LNCQRILMRIRGKNIYSTYLGGIASGSKVITTGQLKKSLSLVPHKHLY